MRKLSAAAVRRCIRRRGKRRGVTTLGFSDAGLRASHRVTECAASVQRVYEPAGGMVVLRKRVVDHCAIDTDAPYGAFLRLRRRRWERNIVERLRQLEAIKRADEEAAWEDDLLRDMRDFRDFCVREALKHPDVYLDDRGGLDDAQLEKLQAHYLAQMEG